MKYFTKWFVLLTCLMLAASLSLTAEENTTVDGVLLVPNAFDTPAIDGDIDPVWYSVTATRMTVMEEGSVERDTYGDHFSTFRLMWDEDNLYVLVVVVDDSLEAPEALDPWNRDNIEIFMDGDNSKNDQETGYDDNDFQWRYVYGSTPGDAAGGPGDFVFSDTDNGYILEIAIDSDTLKWTPEEGHEIGFEIACRDCDSGEPQMNRRWWTTDQFAWNTPSVFGNAELIGREVSEVLDIQYTEDAPEIDGMVEDLDEWYEIPEIPMEVYENDDDPAGILGHWTDHQASYKLMWDEDNLYVLVMVIDDSLEAPEALDPWNRDNIELFLDGDNSKNDQETGYDDNDFQWRYVYGSTPGDAAGGPGDFAFYDTENGYNLEIQIPKDTLKWTPENGHEIGFEIACRDCDSGAPQINRRWWTENTFAWNTASVFGNAELVGGTTALGDDHSQPESYDLGQNYPNPFNPTTTIAYSLDKAEQVRLVVYDLLGQEVSVLVDGFRTAGQHKVEFNGSNLPSGIYFYRMEAGSQVFTNKMMLIK